MDPEYGLFRGILGSLKGTRLQGRSLRFRVKVLGFRGEGRDLGNRFRYLQL